MLDLEIGDRCAAMINELNHRLGWGLDSVQRQQYCAALCSYAPEGCSNARLEQIALAYHADHAYVQALLGRDNPVHNQMWQEFSITAVRILQREGLAQIADRAVDRDDLVQGALLALSRALPNYRYQSRFSTWAYSVVVRSVRTIHRDLNAAKRRSDQESLELDTISVAVPPAEQPDSQAEYRALQQVIHQVLATEGDQRLQAIFQGWAYEDQRLADIGRTLELSTGRVSTLLEQARAILRASPVLRDWLNAHHSEPDD